MKRPSSITLVAAMVTLQVTASMCYPIARYGLLLIEPFTFAFYRYLIASVVLLAIARFSKHKKRVDRSDWKYIILLAVLIIPINQTLFLIGQSMTAAGHGAFIFSTTPLWVFILAMIHLKEKLVWRRLVGILVASIGIIAIMVSGLNEIGSEYLIGDLILLVSVGAWGYYTIIGKNLVRKYGAIRMTAYALAIGSLFYFPFGLYRAIIFDYATVPLAAWGSVVYMALGLSVVVYILWYWLLKYLEASRIAVYHNVQPIIASILAAIFLGEELTAVFVIGGVAVLAGVIIAEVGVKQSVQ